MKSLAPPKTVVLVKKPPPAFRPINKVFLIVEIADFESILVCATESNLLNY